MDKQKQKQKPPINVHCCCLSQEVSSIDWETIEMTEAEIDIINRMHKLVGDRWALIAGRVPGRKAEEIERFWLMKNNTSYSYNYKARIKQGS